MSAIRIPKDGTRVTGITKRGETFRGQVHLGLINAQILCDGLEWERAIILPQEVIQLSIDQPRRAS